MNNSIKLAVINALSGIDSLSNEEILVASCLLYRSVEQNLRFKNANKNNISSIASSFSGNVLNTLSILKDKYLSYYLMLVEADAINKDSFYNYEDEYIERIYLLYLDKTILHKFSTSHFKQSMYKVNNLSHKEYARLQKVHSEVMIPIVLYYKDLNSIQDSDMEIYSSKEYDSDQIGNKIIFGIKDISSSRIINDLKTNRINISFSEVKSYGDIIQIII